MKTKLISIVCLLVLCCCINTHSKEEYRIWYADAYHAAIMAKAAGIPEEEFLDLYPPGFSGVGDAIHKAYLGQPLEENK